MESEVYLAKIVADVRGFAGYLYTAKLVKSILLSAIPQLAEHFKPSKGPEPKLVHVSPLYAEDYGKVKCVYSYAVCGKKEVIKCEGLPKHIVLDGRYFFYFGFHSYVIKPVELFEGLANWGSSCFEFMSQKVCTEVQSTEVYNAHQLGAGLAHRVLDSGFFKVVFSSPTLLRDPLRLSGKYKSYLPTPLTVFAAPVFTYLYVRGLTGIRRLRTELLRLHRLFNETYSTLGGLRIKWVYYSNKPEPALTGYINYRINREYLEFLENRGLKVAEWLGEIFAYTLALGVGTSRATGFGHVELKPLRIRDTGS